MTSVKSYTGPISAEVQAAHASEIERSMFMPSKLTNAKLHANNELQRWVLACNRLLWGGMPADARQPAKGEIAALLEQLSPENRNRQLKESQLAAEARNLVELLSAAEVEAHARLEAQRAEEARAEAEAQARLEVHQAELAWAKAERALREEFEAFDAEEFGIRRAKLHPTSRVLHDLGIKRRFTLLCTLAIHARYPVPMPESSS